MPAVTGGVVNASSTANDVFFAANPKFVGGYQFFSVSGEPPQPAMQVERIMRPNVNGVAYRQTGRRAESFILTAKSDYVSPAHIVDSRINLAGLQGTVITFTNDLIIAYKDFVVEAVIFPRSYRGRPNPRRIKSAIGGLNGSAAQFWMVTYFQLRYALGY